MDNIERVKRDLKKAADKAAADGQRAATAEAIEEVDMGISRFDCPVCFERPEIVFSCQQCHHLVCGRCRANQMMIACPSCRQSFVEKPPIRNICDERLVNDP